MLLTYEKLFKWGGISMTCKCYADVNNKFLKSEDVNKPTSYIVY